MRQRGGGTGRFGEVQKTCANALRDLTVDEETRVHSILQVDSALFHYALNSEFLTSHTQDRLSEGKMKRERG